MKVWSFAWKSHDNKGVVHGKCYAEIPEKISDYCELMQLIVFACRRFMEDHRLEPKEIDWVALKTCGIENVFDTLASDRVTQTPWGMLSTMEFEFIPYTAGKETN